MEGMMQNQLQQPQQQPQPQQPQPAAEKLNQAVQQLLNLEQVKTRTISLFKAISGILEDFDAYARTNTNPNGLRLSGDQRHITPALPMHLADVLTVHEAPQPFADASGMYMKNTPLTSNNMILASSMPYANSARSSTNMMNTPSPQQQQPQPLTQQQQRQKLMQLPQHQQQQLLAQQQLRQSAMQGMGQMQSLSTQTLSDQIFNMGGGNPGGGMMPLQQQQQQQHSSQGAFGSMASNSQNLQPGMVALPNTSQTHPNFSQQRQQNPVMHCAYLYKCCSHALEFRNWLL
ncbi:hypothetical protein K1719_030762 [Acacia pycnantha]|nr:hypothetical protein K1719_030762 [Acacia pycnantha]